MLNMAITYVRYTIAKPLRRDNMKAIVCSKYGSAEVLEIKQLPKPTPKSNELLIKIHATTVSSGDVRVRGLAAPGLLKPIMRLAVGLKRPRIPILGTELSGTIEATGEQVTRFQTGDEVIAFTGMKFGAHAQYICLPDTALIVNKPNNVTFEEATAILFGGTSALHFLRKANLQEGQSILIYGASGSVGSLAVQLAKYFGAIVTGVCSTDNVELVKSLGADYVIDYTKENFVERGAQYDIIFDAVGKISKSSSKAALTPRGRYESVALGYAKELIQDVVLLKQLLENGDIVSVIDSVYTFDNIANAHRRVESGRKKGNVVIKIV